jgi:prepilin-type N-terminal cleavage/methylation domain-containing protein
MRRAWTLIEILVVVSILALLVAILLPCLRAAREQGRRAVCKGHLRQLYYGWNQYADDHEGGLVYCLTWKPQVYLAPPRESTPWLLGWAAPSKSLETMSREDWRDMLGQDRRQCKVGEFG